MKFFKTNTDKEKKNECFELATMLENIGIYDWIISSDTFYFSKSWKAQLGYKEYELKNTFQTWEGLLHPDEKKEVLKQIYNYLDKPQGGYIFEYRLRHKDGSYVWVLNKLGVVRDQKGKAIRLFGTQKDITLKKEAENKLIERYDEVLYGIIKINENGKFIYANPSFCKMSGYTINDLLNLTFQDMKADQNETATFNSLKNKLGIVTVELKTKRGELYSTEIIEDTILINRKKNYLRKIIDVTEKVKSNQDIKNLKDNLELLVKERTFELKSAILRMQYEIDQKDIAKKKNIDSMALKSILSQEITHRVKNNFQIICSLINLQKSRVEESNIIELLDQTTHRIQSMSLIHEVLYSSNTFEDIQFKDYVKSLIAYTKTISCNSNISIDENISDCILPIVDATNLGMILMELITNSLKHAFTKKQKGQIYIYMERRKKKIILTISDNGVGIPSNIDFKQTSTLGLKIVTSLVEQLEGEIYLLPSEGTFFKIVL